MHKLTFDQIIKIGFLFLGILFIVELHEFVKNGRYQTYGDANGVIDTHSGVIYGLKSGPQGSPGSLILKKSTTQ